MWKDTCNSAFNKTQDIVTKRMTSEEAAVTKATIVIEAGEEEGASSSDMMSGLTSLMSEMLGEPQSVTYKTGETIKVQLNPKSYRIESQTNFHSEKMGGIENANHTFGVSLPPKPRTLSVTLFYDNMLQADYLEKLRDKIVGVTQTIQSVLSLTDGTKGMESLMMQMLESDDLNSLYLNKLLGLTTIQPKLNTPPLVSFCYGSTKFKGYVQHVSVEYQRFNKEGQVVRAQVNLKMEESTKPASAGSTTGGMSDSIGLQEDSQVLETDIL